MTETVLESFCERCGTRYTFTEQEPSPESGRSKLGRLGRRSAAESAVEPTIATTLPTSERFDGTFHFCLECRQYACVNCWNSQAGYCVGCRPPGAPEGGDQATSTVSPMVTATSTAAERESAPGKPAAWPTGDLDRTAVVASDGHVHAHGGVHTDPGAAVDASRNGEPPSKIETEDDVATPPQAGADSTGLTVFERPSEPVDEWGRPIAKQPTKQPVATAPDLPFDPSQPAADPWQGVVFSERGDRTGAPTPQATRPGQDDPQSGTTLDAPPVEAPELPVPEQAPLASAAWPESDKGHGTVRTVAAASLVSAAAWPEVDRRGQDTLDRVEPAPVTDVVAVVEPEVIAAPAPVAEVIAAPAPVAEVVALEPEPEPPSAAQRILGLGAVVVGAAAVGDVNAPAEPTQSFPATLIPGVAPPPQVHPPVAAAIVPEVVAPLERSATLAFIEPEAIVTTPASAIEQAPALPVAEPTPRPEFASAPLAPIPVPVTPAGFGPVNPMAGPFAQPYQQPMDAPQVPRPPQPAGAIPMASPKPQQALPQPGSALPPPAQAPLPLVPSLAQPRPGFIAPPPASMAAPGTAPMPSAAQRTASQACASCGLPLSAKARFCRRCGAAQP